MHWANGGPTDLDNLVLLCSAHHRAIHEDGWRMRGHPDRELRFFDPTGRPVSLGSRRGSRDRTRGAPVRARSEPGIG